MNATCEALGVEAAEVSTDGLRNDFRPIRVDERKRLGLVADIDQADGVGLALSGGGIRSASFALGVVQSLLNSGLVRHIDYLSTVSGGGYLGSAVSWWLHQAATAEDFKEQGEKEGHARYAAFREQFGSKVKGARTLRCNSVTTSASNWAGTNWLAYIRQHGNYLQPPGTGYASLAATAFRVCLYSLSVYTAAVVAILCAAKNLEDCMHLGIPVLEACGLVAAALSCAALILLAALYGPASWVASHMNSGAAGFLYKCRTGFRNWSGTILSFLVFGIFLASVPWLYQWGANFNIGARVATAISSLSLGTLGTIYQFFHGRAQSKQPSKLSALRLLVTAALVLYGMLLTDYALVQHSSNVAALGVGSFIFALTFGLFVNSNFSGLARLYRDRLMETFLPPLTGVAQNSWTLATQANSHAVWSLKGHVTRNELLRPATERECPRPLHILNCNVVLMDSPQDKFRTRGGDSFVITPLWSGCDATGWIPTTKLGDGSMSLATAMAISGAAANPNAAPNGLGVTRNRLVSMLMSLFNIRLGYWMARPTSDMGAPSNCPNFWYPGFIQGLLGSNLSEKAAFVELTDGGHFDNTGLYELIRRRTRLIILAQAGCDPAYTMEDLANAIEKVRVDFSVFIDFKPLSHSDRQSGKSSHDPGDAGGHSYTLDDLRPPKIGHLAKRGFAFGSIRYPKGTTSSPEYEEGWLIYIQAVPSSSMSADVLSYWRRNASFPNDTTADQFYDEDNVEAYRELGYSIAEECIDTITTGAKQFAVLAAIRDLLQPTTPQPIPLVEHTPLRS